MIMVPKSKINHTPHFNWMLARNSPSLVCETIYNNSEKCNRCDTCDKWYATSLCLRFTRRLCILVCWATPFMCVTFVGMSWALDGINNICHLYIKVQWALSSDIWNNHIPMRSDSPYFPLPTFTSVCRQCAVSAVSVTPLRTSRHTDNKLMRRLVMENKASHFSWG